MMLTPTLPPFVPLAFGIKLASEDWERAASTALRRHVFCDEQALFTDTDRDAVDAVAHTIVAVDYSLGTPHRVVGTVRIHEDAPAVWYGSRLAIDAEYRAVYGLGRGLVYRAVGTARARGCGTFLANVQARNVDFFARLAWEPLRECVLYGHPHVLMRADLAAYPANCDDASISELPSRRAS